MGAEDVIARIDNRANKAVRLVDASRDPNAQNAKGPQAPLETNRFVTDDLRYPMDIGTNNPERLHYVTFYINVQEKSKYNVTERTEIGPTINSNRQSDSAAGIGTIATEGVGLAGEMVSGAAFGAAIGGAAGEIAGAIAGPEAGVVAAIAGGAVGGAIGTAIVSSIDLARKTKRIKSTISMYMPDTVNHQIVHEYGEISMTEALGMVGAIGQGASAVGTSITETFKKTFGTEGARPDLKGAGMGSLSELAGTVAEKSGLFGTGIKEALLFSAGLAQNPQVEVLYQKTGHREFQFDFRMIPRTRAEAETIRKIIKQFKFHSAPELLPGAQGRFFIPPAEFDIKFFYNGQENININKISSCVLVGIDINYAAAGQWTTFDDGMPVEVQMQLRFKELELMHKGRIEEGY
jgi:uncharacterized protein YcfJ